jgi:hypothetical protein
MEDEKPGINSILLIVFAWMFVIALAYIVFMKIRFLMH